MLNVHVYVELHDSNSNNNRCGAAYTSMIHYSHRKEKSSKPTVTNHTILFFNTIVTITLKNKCACKVAINTILTNTLIYATSYSYNESLSMQL